MGKHGDRIKWASFDGTIPEITFSPDDWDALELAICHDIPEAARADMVRLCNTYLEDKRAEDNAATETDVSNLARIAQKQMAGAFHFLTTFRTNLEPGMTDAESEFESRLEDFLDQQTITIGRDVDGYFRRSFPGMTKEPATLVVTPDLIMEVTAQIMGGLTRIADGSGAPDEGGFQIGAAWQTLLIHSKEWARRNKLPHGASSSSGETPFAAFMFELNKCLPSEWQHPRAASTAAVAQQIRRAIRQHKQKGTNTGVN